MCPLGYLNHLPPGDEIPAMVHFTQCSWYFLEEGVSQKSRICSAIAGII